ncbi:MULTISPECIES: type I 3-dehydroquinate dehydratase [Niallia]|uniref:3-dehydroquinate dehydratase n=1 Tax=Niallia alba TaxID=2729105 RepID=A0A7Y0KBF7_9BACI|nr:MULTISPECIES: type I 3-dehydroquinate dehydratase [Niallia]EOR24142.1 3-dehydroquinate dehydratase [Niallia nealsonii AAU1]MBQ6448294.1 type I 3-dehydroquinate dehydratase [Bacillus sp. (in: firmicutes)]NMO79048.1 type I 3-dehydroquinate dehydratase [Niallia alba]UTI42378.1 type I 3-dehydroquinate dehydratase [Niallia sp. RD1]
MSKSIKVREVIIGDGMPKICVSLIGRTEQELREEAVLLKEREIDIIEWRADYFSEVDNINRVTQVLPHLRKTIGNIPLLFTFRTLKEGGERQIDEEDYFSLNKSVLETGMIDLLDIELFMEEVTIKQVIDMAHSHQIAVILSNHDFEKTPSKEEIIFRLQKAQQLGADIPKIAVMPQSVKDVLTLLDATATMKEKAPDQPIVTMSMGGRGAVSRMAGEIFGSAITFAAAKKASAPGQIPIEELRNILTVVHKSL